MDGDGVPEIGVARKGSFRNYPKWVVYKWNGNGLTQYIVGGSNWGKDVTATDLSFGDIDGASGSELLMTRSVKSGPTIRFIAHAKGDTFGDNGITPFGLGYPAGVSATCLAAADIDGDGKAEVVIGRSVTGDYNIEVRGDRAEGYDQLYKFGKQLRASNSPQSSWNEGSISVSSSAYPTAVCYGDTDGNGLLEVIVGTSISLRGFDRVIVRPVGSSRRMIR